MKKVLLGTMFLFALVLMTLGFGTSSSAAEKGSFKTDILDIKVEIPYEESSVNIERESNYNSETIKVYDKETGELLKTSKASKSAPKGLSAVTPNATTSIYTVSESRTDNGLVSTINAELELYSSGSFRQINDVLRTYWTTSSGNHDLVNTGASYTSTDGSFPTTEVQVSGSATIEIVIEQSAEAGFEAAGFSISAGASSTYTARKNIREGLVYSTY